MTFTAISIYSVLSLLALLASAVVLIIQSAFSLGFGAVLAVYILLLSSLGLFAVGTFKTKEYAGAFNYKNNYKLNVLSFMCAAGFGVEMVSNLLQLYDYISGDVIIFGRAPMLILTAAASLVSAFSMALVGISFGDTKYDFRRIGFIAFVPLFWSMLRMGMMLTEAVNVASDVPSALKIIALIFTMSFFYRFSVEAIKDENASAQTAFVSGALFIVGVLFFISRLTLTFQGEAEVISYDNLLSVTILTASLFSVFFRRNIITNS